MPAVTGGPVLAGVGAVVGDGTRDVSQLAAEAIEAAFADAGLPVRADLVLVPKGTWTDLAVPLDARVVWAEVGILQQELITRACRAIARGEAEVVVVVGAEARHRNRLTGLGDPPGAPPDEVLRPDGEIVTRTEVERDLVTPAHQYAVIESALGDGSHLPALWEAFGKVAATNPDAWDRTAPSAAEIAADRMVATPYTRRLCSQWNVDQAAALVLTSVGGAREGAVFPVAFAQCDDVVPLPVRPDLGRWPAFAAVAAAVGASEAEHVDLYSCFPSAVQVQAAELGLPLDPVPTVTGGMTFAGGPFNSYLLHATVTMARVLREDPSARGIVTNVSGLLSKPAAAAWSCTPPSATFEAHDMRCAAPRLPLDPDAVGEGRIVGSTWANGHRIAVLDMPGGVRTVAVGSEEGDVVRVVSPGRF